MFRSLPQLEAYYWVARLGSFAAAADRLGLTQPAISIRVRDFEKALGEPAFVRGGRNIALTSKGRDVFDRIEQIVALVSGLDGDLFASGALRSPLRIGVPDSFALCCLPRLITLFSMKYPDNGLAITVDNSRILAQKLSGGELDIAVLSQPEVTGDIDLHPFGEQVVSWISAPRADFADRELSPGDLGRSLILTNPAPSPTYRILVEWFAQGGIIPARLMTCTSIAAISATVRETDAICVVPHCVVQADLHSGRLQLMRVRPELPPQRVFIASPRGMLRRNIRELSNIIRRSAEGSGFVAAPPK